MSPKTRAVLMISGLISLAVFWVLWVLLFFERLPIDVDILGPFCILITITFLFIILMIKVGMGGVTATQKKTDKPISRGW